jgi:hypothetical protein
VSFVDGFDETTENNDSDQIHLQTTEFGHLDDFKSSMFIRESQFLTKKSALQPITINNSSSMSQSEQQQQSPSMIKHAEMKQKHMLRHLLIPKMTILIMVVGTRGDVQPFTELGMRLKLDGHRVRVATHATFRNYILEKGLEFYPLAGDPMLLSEFMVKTQGFLIPTSAELIFEVISFLVFFFLFKQLLLGPKVSYYVSGYHSFLLESLCRTGSERSGGETFPSRFDYFQPCHLRSYSLCGSSGSSLAYDVSSALDSHKGISSSIVLFKLFQRMVY